MSKQWILVVAVLVGLAVGSAALVWYGPEVEPVAVGAKAPDYRAVDLASGDSVAIRAHYRGHVTLVNIWATWCGPCKEEMPSMQLLYDSLRSAGFRIAAVSIDRDDADAVKSFASDLKLSFDILQDRSGEIQQAYQTTGVPESFLLDTNGVIMKRVIGAHNWASPANQALVRRLMGAPAGGHVSPAADAAPADSVPATGR
jgi:thiol-disulfide isomerase/thioredoxin